MIELFGHLHPLIVHLPIGILLIALLIQWMVRKEKYVALKHAIPTIIFFGAASALAASITGYMLSISDDYDQSLVNWHMWMAIAVVVVSFMLYTKEINPRIEVSKNLLSIGLFFLLMGTGHLGGTLTHGSDYLTKPFFKIFSSDTVNYTVIKPLNNVQEALMYKDIVQPILETKCYSCHNQNKQKGGLRMDEIQLLLKGGKHGKIIDLANADSSEMIKRLLLPADNEHHMPPKEKPQPSESQIKLLHWWISNKAAFTKKVKEMPQPDKIKPVLLALQKPAIIKKATFDLPATPAKKADENILQQLTEKGFLVLPVAQNSNYLMVNNRDKQKMDKEDAALLAKLSAQLVVLKINNSTITEDAFQYFSKFTNLRRLNLSYTNVTDDALKHLNSLQSVQQLTLVGTKVTAGGIAQLKQLKSLLSLYLYQTNVRREDFKKLKSSFPKVEIDSGNYVVPLLATDTTEVTAPIIN